MKWILFNPLTIVVWANTAIALISDRWPPIQADKAVTIAFPLALWAAYVTIEWPYRNE